MSTEHQPAPHAVPEGRCQYCGHATDSADLVCAPCRAVGAEPAPHADRDGSEVRYPDAVRSLVNAAKAQGKAQRTIADLRAEVARWTEKAQEAGAAYANANTKHHAEWERANRLEGMAERLAERAVDLEDRARKAEAALARVDALARAVVNAWDEAAPCQPCDDCLRSGVELWSFGDDERVGKAVDDIRAALPEPEAEAVRDET